MNRLFTTKDIVYAAKTGGGTISGINEINLLQNGALAVFTEKGEVITSANAIEVIADTKTFQIALGRKKENAIISLIPRLGIRDFNVASYVAPVAKVITVGGTDSATSLTFDTEGECFINVQDVSYTSKYSPRSARASVYKRSYMSEEQTVDKLVERLNLSTEFITASKVGTSPNFGVVVTPVDPSTDIAISVGGSFEGNSVAVTTNPVVGVGVGEDLLQLEKDFSVEEGNGNYTEYTAEWYKREMQTDPDENYDVITFVWEGTHSSPTRSTNVMFNRVSIGIPTGASNITIDDLKLALTPLIGGVYDTTLAVEPANDERGGDSGESTDL